MSLLPLIGAGIGVLNGITQGRAQDKAERLQRDELEWRKRLDRLAGGYEAQDRGLNAANNNALNPLRRQLIAMLSGRLGFQHPLYDQLGTGGAPAPPVNMPNPLQGEPDRHMSPFFQKISQAIAEKKQREGY